MTREQVQDRIKQLEAERDQVKATLLMYEGAIQDNTRWLSQLDTPPIEQETES